MCGERAADRPIDSEPHQPGSATRGAKIGLQLAWHPDVEAEGSVAAAFIASSFLPADLDLFRRAESRQSTAAVRLSTLLLVAEQAVCRRVSMATCNVE
jgi:hypothetical protein